MSCLWRGVSRCQQVLDTYRQQRGKRVTTRQKGWKLLWWVGWLNTGWVGLKPLRGFGPFTPCQHVHAQPSACLSDAQTLSGECWCCQLYCYLFCSKNNRTPCISHIIMIQPICHIACWCQVLGFKGFFFHARPVRRFIAGVAPVPPSIVEGSLHQQFHPEIVEEVH